MRVFLEQTISITPDKIPIHCVQIKSPAKSSLQFIPFRWMRQAGNPRKNIPRFEQNNLRDADGLGVPAMETFDDRAPRGWFIRVDKHGFQPVRVRKIHRSRRRISSET